MLQPAPFLLVELLDRRALSDEQVRYLVGWQALLLVDLLQRRCITVRYAEQVLFNLDVLQRIKRRRLPRHRYPRPLDQCDPRTLPLSIQRCTVTRPTSQTGSTSRTKLISRECQISHLPPKSE